MAALLEKLETMDGSRCGKTAAELVELAKGDSELRDVVEALAGRLDSRALGNKLRSYRRRNFAGRYLDRAGEDHRASRWAVYPAKQFSAGANYTRHTRDTHHESDEFDESYPVHPKTDPVCNGWNPDRY